MSKISSINQTYTTLLFRVSQGYDVLWQNGILEMLSSGVQLIEFVIFDIRTHGWQHIFTRSMQHGSWLSSLNQTFSLMSLYSEMDGSVLARILPIPKTFPNTSCTSIFPSFTHVLPSSRGPLPLKIPFTLWRSSSSVLLYHCTSYVLLFKAVTVKFVH